jgi:DNA-binding MarR family transcriptional regulator
LQVWKALAGHRLIAKEIGEVINADDSSVRRAIRSMRQKGYEIRGGADGPGYWRPDAPPFG